MEVEERLNIKHKIAIWTERDTTEDKPPRPKPKVDKDSCTIKRSTQDLIVWYSKDGAAYCVHFTDGSPFSQRDFTVPAGGAATAGPAIGPVGTYEYEVTGGQCFAVADPDVVVEE